MRLHVLGEGGGGSGRPWERPGQVAGKGVTRDPMPVSKDGCEEPGLSSVRDKPCACVLWRAKWGAPKNKKEGVQGMSNPSVPPQDRELRPEEIEGKGFRKELEFLEGWGLGVHTGEGHWEERGRG